MAKYRGTPKLLEAISKGEFKSMGVSQTVYYSKHFDCLIDINKDWTLKLVVDEDAILNNPDFFEEIK